MISIYEQIAGNMSGVTLCMGKCNDGGAMESRLAGIDNRLLLLLLLLLIVMI